jgi:hypothetical protein
MVLRGANKRAPLDFALACPATGGSLVQERWQALLFEGLFPLIDELSAEFATDPPCQPTLAWIACR